MVDGSGSVSTNDFTQAQQFAKDTVAAFSGRSLFENGGTASYVQFSSAPLDMGTFFSEEDFNAHVDLVTQYNGSTDVVNGTQLSVPGNAYRPYFIERSMFAFGSSISQLQSSHLHHPPQASDRSLRFITVEPGDDGSTTS